MEDSTFAADEKQQFAGNSHKRSSSGDVAPDEREEVPMVSAC